MNIDSLHDANEAGGFEAVLLQRFRATLDDTQLPLPLVHVDEDELLSTLLKRKSRSGLKIDGKNRSALKLDSTIRKKGSKGKNKLKLDDDLGDGLISALLDDDVTPENLEFRYGPKKDRNKS